MTESASACGRLVSRDFVGWKSRSRSGLPIVCVPRPLGNGGGKRPVRRHIIDMLVGDPLPRIS